MQRSIKKEIMTNTRPTIERISKNNKAVIMKETSINPNITRNIVVIITPDVHTHSIPFNVPYTNMQIKIPKTNHVIVDNKVPEKSIGYIVAAMVDFGQVSISNVMTSEITAHEKYIKLNRIHNKVNM